MKRGHIHLSPEPRLESCSGEFFPVGDPFFSLPDKSELVVFGLLSKNLARNKRKATNICEILCQSHEKHNPNMSHSKQ